MHLQLGATVWVRRTGGGAPSAAAGATAWLPGTVASVNDATGAVTVRTEDGREAPAAAADVQPRADEAGVQVRGGGGGGVKAPR
jgi:hypothetical protein